MQNGPGRLAGITPSRGRPSDPTGGTFARTEGGPKSSSPPAPGAAKLPAPRPLPALRDLRAALPS